MSATVTDEAVAAMGTTAASLLEAIEAVNQAISSLEGTFEATQSGLGAHSASIGALIEEAKAVGSEGNNSIKILALKLTKAAAIRQAHIDTDNYKRSR